jgi:hypothetical protein
MDMREYSGTVFLKADDVRDGPRRERIVKVGIGKFDRPLVEFDGGDRLTLNVTNCKTLIKHLGLDSRDWVGAEIELFLGTTTYNGEQTDSVLIRPLSVKPPKPAAQAQQRSQQNAHGGGYTRGDMDDEIPF